MSASFLEIAGGKSKDSSRCERLVFVDDEHVTVGADKLEEIRCGNATGAGAKFHTTRPPEARTRLATLSASAKGTSI